MRLTAIINLPVVFLALVIGAAAAPVGGSNVYQLAESNDSPDSDSDSTYPTL
ncbi:hypothetical protein V8E52_011719 [Russula decolorans]